MKPRQPKQLLKEIRRIRSMSSTQALTLMHLAEAERKGRLEQALPLLEQLHRELVPKQRAKAAARGMTEGMQRAWIYSQLTHPELLQERKAEAIAVARRIEFDEHDDRDKEFISQFLGVRI
jgi:hypothetical protein